MPAFLASNAVRSGSDRGPGPTSSAAQPGGVGARGGHASAERRPGRALPRIEPARCTGCGWCVAVCAPGVLALAAPGGPGARKRSLLQAPAGCTGCARCALRCPFGAIAMQRPAAPAGAPA